MFVIAIVRAIVLFVIATWFIWAGITAAIIAVVWMQLHQAHKDPLLVQVERGDDEVVFVIRRRTWSKAFPAEAARRAAPRRDVVRSP